MSSALTEVRFKRLAEHVDGCAGVRNVKKGTWASAWFITGESQWLNKAGNQTGRGLGGYRWQILRCNDPACPAQVMVRDDDILYALGATT